MLDWQSFCFCAAASGAPGGHFSRQKGHAARAAGGPGRRPWRGVHARYRHACSCKQWRVFTVVASGFTERRCLCFQAKEPWAQTTRTRRAPSASWPRPPSPSLSPASLSCWTETTKTWRLWWQSQFNGLWGVSNAPSHIQSTYLEFDVNSV